MARQDRNDSFPDIKKPLSLSPANEDTSGEENTPVNLQVSLARRFKLKAGLLTGELQRTQLTLSCDAGALVHLNKCGNILPTRLPTLAGSGYCVFVLAYSGGTVEYL